MTEPDRVVVLEGEGQVVIDGERVLVNGSGVCTQAGDVYNHGDVVTINGRSAKVAVVQQQEQKRQSSAIMDQINRLN